MSKFIYVILPVADVAASTRFYEALGCRKNEQFSGETAVSMVWSDAIVFQLAQRDYFATFTPKPIGDAQAACQALLCLSCDGRAEIDTISAAAARHGGKVDIRAPIDSDFMYNRAFEDPDGHAFELVWMNPDAAMPAKETAAAD